MNFLEGSSIIPVVSSLPAVITGRLRCLLFKTLVVTARGIPLTFTRAARDAGRPLHFIGCCIVRQHVLSIGDCAIRFFADFYTQTNGVEIKINHTACGGRRNETDDVVHRENPCCDACSKSHHYTMNSY